MMRGEGRCLAHRGRPQSPDSQITAPRLLCRSLVDDVARRGHGLVRPPGPSQFLKIVCYDTLLHHLLPRPQQKTALGGWCMLIQYPRNGHGVRGVLRSKQLSPKEID